MSRDVEQRVVEMRFDNAQFERGISQSQASLTAFNQSLGELGGSRNGLAAFAASLKGISFNPINDGIQIGIGKLSALTAALTGVSNIANTIYNKVTGMVRTMSGIDNLTAGWSKYATKTEAIQTIMAATRKEGESEAATMARVNEQIEQLSWFADETSYSLNDMTTAVGNFTSAGVDLEVATESVQGIALWAATAGVNSRKAATAFQQLAQAMSKGVLKTDDWKSLETLNMPSMEFKKQALEIAASLKTLTKVGDKYFTSEGNEVTAEGMRSTLADGWFTADVMNEVFKKYGNMTKEVKKLAEEQGITASDAIKQLKRVGVEADSELSLRAMEIGQEAKTFQEAIDSITDAASTKFTDIFETIFGNYLEAKKIWTDLANGLYKVFVDPLWEVADAFKEWKKEGGRDSAIASVYQIIHSIWNVFSMFKELWEEFWDTKGERTKKILDGITTTIGKLSSYIYKLSQLIMKNQTVIDNFSAFAEGTKNLLDSLKQIIVDIFNEIAKRFNGNGGPIKIIEAISKIFGWIGKLLTRISELINDSKVVSKMFSLFDTVSSKLKRTFELLGDVFKRIFDSGKDRNIIWQMGEAAIEFKSPLETIRDILATIIDLATDVMIELTPMISAIWSFIKSLISFIGKLVESFAPMIKNAVGMLTQGILQATQSMTDYFANAQFTNPFETISNVIKKIAEAIGKFAAIIIENIAKVRLANMNRQGNQKGFLENLGDAVVNFAENLYGHKEAIEWMKRVVFDNKDIIASLTAIATGLIDALTHVAASVLILYGITKLFNLLCAIWSGDEGGGGLFSKATGLVKGFKTIYSSFMNIAAKFANASLIKSFAFLIGSFAVSIFLLASLPAEQVIKAAVVLAAGVTLMGIVIAGLIKLLKSYEKTLDYEDYGLGEDNQLHQDKKRHQSGIWQLAVLIDSVSAAMVMMAASIAIIASCANWDSAVVAFVGLTVLIAAVAGILMAIKTSGFTQEDVSVIGIVAVLFLGIGKMLHLTGKAVASIANSNEDNIYKAVAALLMILAAVVTMTLYISALKPESDTLKGMATMLTQLGIMFLAVAFAMKIVSKIDNIANAVPAIAILVVVVAALVGMVTLAAKCVENIDSGTQVAALAMVAVIVMNMVGMVIAIAGAILLIATLVEDSDKITTATIAIGSIVAIVGLLLALASLEMGEGKGANLKQMVSFAAGFALMGLAILAFVPALIACSNFNFGQLMGFVGFVAALIAIFLGASAASNIPQVAAGMALLSQSLIYIGAAALAASTGVLLIAFGISLVVDAFAQFVELGPAAAEQIKSTMEAFGSGMVDVFKGFGNGLVAMFDTLVENKESIFKLVAVIVAAMVTGFQAAVPAFLTTIEETLTKIVELVVTLGPKLTMFVNDTLAQLISDLLDIIINLGPKLNDAVTTLVESALLDILGLLKNVFPEINNTLNLLLVDAAYELADNINTMTGIAIGALSSLADDLMIGLPMLTIKFTAIGVELIVAFIAGLIVGINKSIPVFCEAWATSFVEMVDEMCRVIDEHSEEVYEAICKMIKKALEAVAEWAGRMYYDLTADGPFTMIKKICSYITDGFNKGFESEANKAKLAKTMKNMAAYGNSVYCSAQGIASPSKVWEQFGGFQVEGLVDGIKGGFGSVKNVGKDLATALNNSFTGSFGGMAEKFKAFGSSLIGSIGGNLGTSFKDMLSGGLFSGSGSLNNMFDGALDLNPTITPSLDLSLVEKQSSGLDSLFSNNQVKSISDITDWSQSQTALQDQLKENNALETKAQVANLTDMLGKYLDIQQYNAEQPTNVNVTLEGDASKMLKLIKIEDTKASKATGSSYFNRGKNTTNSFLNIGKMGYNS